MAIFKGKIRQRNSGGTYDYLLPETTIDMVNGLRDELDSKVSDSKLLNIEELVIGVGLLSEKYPRLESDGTDDAPRIRRAIDDALQMNVGTIRLSSNEINVESTIDLPEGIELVGINSASGTTGIKGTRINRKANIIAFQSIGTSVLTGSNNRRIKFTNLHLNGGGYVEDFARFIANTMLVITDCHFIGMGGRQLLLHEVTDSRIVNCTFESGGNISGIIPAIEVKSGEGYEFTNQVHFVGCRWESYRGTAIKSRGSNTNEIFFTNCKFESLSSIVPHIDFTNVNIVSFDNVNVCSQGTVSNTLSEQVKLTNCKGVFGAFFLEHNGSIDNDASKINRFITIDSSSDVDILVYVYQNGNNILSQSCVMVGSSSDDQSVSIRGYIKDDTYVKTICNNTEKSRSTVIGNKNPYLRFSRPDVLGEYWDSGRVVVDGTKTKYQFIHGDKTLGERPIFEVNANSEFKVFRDLMMEGRAIHLSQLSSAPYGRNGSMYYDNNTNTIKAYINGSWKTLNFT